MMVNPFISRSMMCLRGFCEGLSYLPLIMIVLTLETFILSDIFAVSKGDVNPYFPYIRYSFDMTKEPSTQYYQA